MDRAPTATTRQPHLCCEADCTLHPTYDVGGICCPKGAVNCGGVCYDGICIREGGPVLGERDLKLPPQVRERQVGGV